MTDHVELRPGTLADLPALEPLWVSVHHQHTESMPELAPCPATAARAGR